MKLSPSISTMGLATLIFSNAIADDGFDRFQRGERERVAQCFSLTNEVTRLNFSDDVLLFILADA
jgi:hypothetical protein